MTIHRLLYRSDMDLVGTVASIQQQVSEITRSSQIRNVANDLTGALMHTRGVFIQALEGPLPAIEATFERICCDLRHRRVELLELVQAEKRVFGEWSMTSIWVDATIGKLIPPLESGALASDPASAQATIQLMRSLLIAGEINVGAPLKGAFI